MTEALIFFAGFFVGAVGAYLYLSTGGPW